MMTSTRVPRLMRFFGGCTAGCSLASDTDIPPICEFVLARMMPHPGKCCKAGERDTQLPFPCILSDAPPLF